MDTQYYLKGDSSSWVPLFLANSDVVVTGLVKGLCEEYRNEALAKGFTEDDRITVSIKKPDVQIKEGLKWGLGKASLLSYALVGGMAVAMLYTGGEWQLV